MARGGVTGADPAAVDFVEIVLRAADPHHVARSGNVGSIGLALPFERLEAEFIHVVAHGRRVAAAEHEHLAAFGVVSETAERSDGAAADAVPRHIGAVIAAEIACGIVAQRAKVRNWGRKSAGGTHHGHQEQQGLHWKWSHGGYLGRTSTEMKRYPQCTPT